MLPDLSSVRKTAGERIYEAGEIMFQRGGVREELVEQLQLKYLVHDTPARHVIFDATDSPCCSCEDYLTLGDKVTVVCLGKDKMGRVSFSMKDVPNK